ncbi:adhesin, partial [Salmonella enterica subsp. diarizonae]|nr:adhesin [Salmonella enterica subsp. diarizonae]
KKNKLILSSDMEKINGQHSAYIVRGKNNPNHILMVRIGGRGWNPDKEGEGMLYQVDGNASFNVYAYKNLAIYADTYVLSFYAYLR